MTYADLISANAAALATQEETHKALASAIRQAGGFLVDPSANPPMLYTSDDGQSYAARPIPSAADPVPGMDPGPAPGPLGPVS